tara:strand:- start:344 stop:643 length:300 start_codon:yes stop_codon:yes gene_type:complete
MKVKTLKFVYLLLSIFCGLTVGVLVAAIVGICSAIETLIRFPFQVYHGAVSGAEYKRLNQAFNVQTMEDLERKRWESMTEDEKMWERHIQKMEKKKHNN